MKPFSSSYTDFHIFVLSYMPAFNHLTHLISDKPFEPVLKAQKVFFVDCMVSIDLNHADNEFVVLTLICRK